jgi:predicted aldo/keto reductase-like oxidoreductase
MERMAELAPGLPRVCRLGLATRGNTRLRQEDVQWAVGRGINYLNWCGHPDGMSQAIAHMGEARRQVVVAAQFEARTATHAAHEFCGILDTLGTDYVDILTLYYVESPDEWSEIRAPGGALAFLAEQKRLGRLKMIGLTSYQRELGARWAREGVLDMLMIRYNAAHRGAERDVFPVAREQGIPVVTFTGLRWKALLESTPDAPEGFEAPSARDCYRFCLAEPGVSVALTAPGTREELEDNLKLLEDWHPPQPGERESMRRHGDRVRRHAGTFW